MGTLHAGALSGVLELAGYLALLPRLSESEHAVTHAISAQFVNPAQDGETVAVVGRLLRRGRSVAFVHAVATVGSRVVAEAQITKSVISAR